MPTGIPNTSFIIDILQLIDVLHDRIANNPRLQSLAYWCKCAGLATSNVYLQNTNFFGDTTKSGTHYFCFNYAGTIPRLTIILETSYNFWSDLAKRFPLQKGEKISNIDLPDPLWGKGNIKDLEVVKVFLSGIYIALVLPLNSLGHNPCLFKVTYMDDTIEESKIFMKADDCRSDMCVMTMFKIFTVLCNTSGTVYILRDLTRPRLVGASRDHTVPYPRW